MTSTQHFKKDPELDEYIKKEFLVLHGQATRGELFKWRRSPGGVLAEILILDQFSRNIYRDDPRAFAQDPLALALAQFAIERGIDKNLSPNLKGFLYMPFMHSESQVIHEEAIRLFAQPGLEQNLDFEKRHKVIIDRFGRYPHRNITLGRESSDEEVEFLKDPKNSF